MQELHSLAAASGFPTATTGGGGGGGVFTAPSEEGLRLALKLSEEKNSLLDSKYRELKRKYIRTSMKSSEIKRDMVKNKICCRCS